MNTEGTEQNTKEETFLTIRMDRFEESPHQVGIFRNSEPIEYVPITDEAYLTIKAKASIEGRDPGEVVAEVVIKGLGVA